MIKTFFKDILFAFIGFVVAACSALASKQTHPIFIILFGPLFLLMIVGIAAYGDPSGLVFQGRTHFVKYGVVLIAISSFLSLSLSAIWIGFIGAAAFLILLYYEPNR